MGKRIWIVIAVVLLLVGGVVLGGVAVLVAILPGVWVISETLQQSDGLGDTAFDVGWWLSTIGLITVLAICLARAVHKKEGATVGAATWPIWIYGAAHLVMALVFGLLGMGPIAHLPAVVMSYVAQTIEMYIGWVFPLLLLGIFVRSLWRWAKASWIEDGRGAQIAGTIVGGVLLCSIGGGVGSLLDRGYTLAMTDQPAGSGEWFSPTADRKFHTWAANSVVPPSQGGALVDSLAPSDLGALTRRTQMTFTQCANQLADSGEWQLCARRAERAVPGDGDDIAQTTLLNVCLKVEQDGVDDLVEYYSKACTNGIRTKLRRGRLSPIDTSVDPVDRLRPIGAPPPQGIVAGIDCVERVKGRFSHSERQVLELAKLGHKAGEIAALIGERSNTVSQRLSRLRQKLRENCFSTYRPVYRRGWR